MFLVKKLSIATVGTIALGLGSVAPVNAASLYEITGLDFTPTDINNSAQIVGEGYLWEDGKVTDLTGLSSAYDATGIFATSINNNGVIVGGRLGVSSDAPNADSQPFISDGNTISYLSTDYSSCFTGNCNYELIPLTQKNELESV